MSSELVKRLGNALDALMIAPAGERAQREAKVRELVSRLSLALTEAQAKLVEAEKDAERYRWLRDGANECNVEVPNEVGYVLPGYAEKLDAAIDAHRSSKP